MFEGDKQKWIESGAAEAEERRQQKQKNGLKKNKGKGEKVPHEVRALHTWSEAELM